MIATIAGTFLVTIALGAPASPTTKPESDARSAPPPPAKLTELRLARSADGLTFADVGRTFAAGAAAPDLARLPNGDLLAMFDHWVDGDDDGEAVLAVSRSRDAGRTWSPMRLARVLGPGQRRVAGVHGDLVEVAEGRYRLYCTMTRHLGDADRDGRGDAVSMVLSAVTRDGIEYRIDGRIRGDLAAMDDLHPVALWTGSHVHLYAAQQQPDDTDASTPEQAVAHVVSADGRRFTDAPTVHIPQVSFVGSLVPVGEAVRAYVTSSKGIVSLVSDNGRDWKPEPSLRISGGWDPAVTRLEDGSFLMIYCAQRKGRVTSSDSVVADADGTARQNDSATETMDPAEGEDSTDQEGRPASGVNEHPLVEPLSEEDLAWLDETESLDSLVEGDLQSIDQSGWLEADADVADDWSDDAWASGDGLDLAPRPDFETHFNYLEWFEQHCVPDVVDNAFDVYASSCPSWTACRGRAKLGRKSSTSTCSVTRTTTARRRRGTRPCILNGRPPAGSANPSSNSSARPPTARVTPSARGSPTN